VKRSLRWGALAAIAAALVAHSLVFNFVCDDAYISFVYARNLAEHGQLVFNPGERVEGYTNFGWTVLLGALMAIGIPPEISSLVVAAMFAIGTLVLAARLMARVRGEESAWDLLPAALLAISSGYACWTSGGLETQMFTFFCTLGLLFYLEDRLPACGLAFAAAAMTRPEGILVFGVVGLHWLFAQLAVERPATRTELLWPLAFAALFVPYFAWRWSYYGWPFPNTFYVKAGGKVSPQFGARLREFGLHYVWQWATQSKAIFALPLVLAAFWKRARFAFLAVLVAGAFLAYVVSIGGDFMGLHRFIMPVFVVVALAASIGLADAARFLPAKARAAPAILLVAAFAWSQASLSKRSLEPRADRGIDRPGYLKVYAHDRGAIGKALAPHVLPGDFGIFGGAGVQPYYARMPGYDVFGLVSEKIAHDVPPGNPRPGHSKWGPASLLLPYQPSFVFSCYALTREPDPPHPPWRCPDAPVWMARGYEKVTIYVPGLKESGEYYTFLKRRDRAWP
jgi:arabinofuranosyltransferase